MWRIMQFDCMHPQHYIVHKVNNSVVNYHVTLVTTELSEL